MLFLKGELSEWLKEPASKTGVRVTVPGVRIPHSPQSGMASQRSCGAFLMSGRCKLACIRTDIGKAPAGRRPGMPFNPLQGPLRRGARDVAPCATIPTGLFDPAPLVCSHPPRHRRRPCPICVASTKTAFPAQNRPRHGRHGPLVCVAAEQRKSLGTSSCAF